MARKDLKKKETYREMLYRACKYGEAAWPDNPIPDDIMQWYKKEKTFRELERELDEH